MASKVGLVMTNSMSPDLDKHWYQKLELREALMMCSHEVMVMKFLRVHHRAMYLVQNLGLSWVYLI